MAWNASGAGYFAITGSTPVTAVPLTMACWFRVESGANGGLMSIALESSGRHYFYLYADTSAIYAGVAETSDVYATSTAAPSVGTWAHGCAVFASNTSRTIYLDGGNSATDTSNVTPAGVNKIYVGSYAPGHASPLYFKGDIAEPAIWNVALDAAEITALARGISPDQIRPASLVWYRSMLTFDGWWNHPNVGPDFASNGPSITTVPHCRQFYKKRRGFGVPNVVSNRRRRLICAGGK